MLNKINKMQMMINPELHYLQHVQNNSMSKEAHHFSKANRFKTSSHLQTDFKYHPKIPAKSRSCTFGFGSRADLSRNTTAPGPNSYNLSKFPCSKRSTTIGFSRQRVKFGTIKLEIERKAKMPPPGAYDLGSSLRVGNFTLKDRLPDEITIALKKGVPGPGKYQAVAINPYGRYPSSKFKNTRYIIIDSLKKGLEEKPTPVGPGSYDLYNQESRFNAERIKLMRRTKTKTFGTAKRRGPQQQHRLFVPAPGYYSNFSAFDCSYTNEFKRSRTEYTQEE